MKFVIPAALAMTVAILGLAQLTAHQSEQATADAVAQDLADAQLAARRAIAEARIDGMRPPLPVLHVYDADEDNDMCPVDHCAGSAGYNGSSK